jgi:hypothetical protein
MNAASAVFLFACAAAEAATMEISLAADSRNPSSPQMGDRITFISTIENKGATAARGVVAWISLVQVDPGQEKPMDLEDWSAQKAVTRAELSPGERFTVEWPMRLIQAGTFRVAVSGADRSSPRIVSSPFIEFSVRSKPVVESGRILPVALGMPLILVALMLARLRWR